MIEQRGYNIRLRTHREIAQRRIVMFVFRELAAWFRVREAESTTSSQLVVAEPRAFYLREAILSCIQETQPLFAHHPLVAGRRAKIDSGLLYIDRRASCLVHDICINGRDRRLQE